MTENRFFARGEKVGVWPFTTFTGRVISGGQNEGDLIVVRTNLPDNGSFFFEPDKVIRLGKPTPHKVLEKLQKELERHGYTVIAPGATEIRELQP